MKYHYTKPTEYSSMYGQLYECNHPAYNHCTLYLIGDKGLAVIQQRYDKKSKCTWWSEIDRCLTDIGDDALGHFGEYEDDSVFVRNDEEQTDYEILLDGRNYHDVYGDTDD